MRPNGRNARDDGILAIDLAIRISAHTRLRTLDSEIVLVCMHLLQLQGASTRYPLLPHAATNTSTASPTRAHAALQHSFAVHYSACGTKRCGSVQRETRRGRRIQRGALCVRCEVRHGKTGVELARSRRRKRRRTEGRKDRRGSRGNVDVHARRAGDQKSMCDASRCGD